MSAGPKADIGRTAPGLRFSTRDRQRLAKLAALCETLPELEFTAAGQRHLALCVRRKTLAYYLHDHHGDGIVCLCCKATPARQQELVAAGPDRYLVPAYLGVKGWVSLRLDRPKVSWDEVFDLVVAAYRLQAPRRLAAEME